MKHFFIFGLFLHSLCIYSFAQTNLYPLYSSGPWGSTAHLKLSATSGWVTVTHYSADPGNSAVYDFESGKNAYWGESTDGGNYIFRGRNLLVQEGLLGVGALDGNYKLNVNGFTASKGYTISNTNDNFVKSVNGSSTFHLVGTYNGWDPNAVYIAASHAGNTSKTGYPATTRRVNIGNPYFDNNYLTVDLVGGGVGIGTSTTGSFKLAVEGSIGARLIKVTQQNPFPDYVFTPGYSLLSLDSLNSYIQTNHHLPEIPSADSVKKDGLDLGANQTLLLKKIEELTLYIIDMKKKEDRLTLDNSAQKQEIEELKAAINRIAGH